MASSRNYFHDHLVLVLLSIEAFLAVAGSVMVLLLLGSRHSSGYIVQYRFVGGQAAFQKGSVTELLSFIGFAFLIFGLHTVLSLRTYRIHRQVSIAILSLGILLLVLNVIVSNALLSLR